MFVHTRRKSLVDLLPQSASTNVSFSSAPNVCLNHSCMQYKAVTRSPTSKIVENVWETRPQASD
jgi:hypothetical protein